MDTKQRILDEALTLFSEKGYANVFVNDIAERKDISDISMLKDIIKFMVSYLREQSLPTVRVMRLAGEPTVDEAGVSYYVLRRATAERMLAEHFEGEGPKDPSAFTRTNSDAFMNIFTAPSSEYLCYLMEQGKEPRAVRQ